MNNTRRDILCCGIPVVKHLSAEIIKKRSIINVNLKKYPRQIQHPVTDLKIELLAKIVNDYKL